MTSKKKDKILGIDRNEYSQQSSEYSKSVVTWWIMSGVVYSLVSGTFASISTILLFLPGIFVVSFASMPFFLLRVKKQQSITAMNERDGALLMMGQERQNSIKDVPKLLFYTATTILGFLFPIISAIVFIRVMHQL